MKAVLAELRTGRISAPIALARLVLAGETALPERLAAITDEDASVAELAALAEAQRDRLGVLAGLAAEGMDPAGEDQVAATAALFDRLAADAPEAGVAFYSLGDPALLARATDELAGVVRAWARVAGRRVLDFGCGIGRASFALADEATSVLGIDVSAGMMAQAQARVGDRANVRFEVANGRDLAGIGDASIDLVLAADSFPYLVRAGTLERQVAEIARVLAPGGDLLVFNWSYRGDPDADLDEARTLAAAHGFELARAGERPFALWDATGFHLRKSV